MSKVGHPGRRSRALWSTLAVLCLVGAGASYGMSRISRSEAEFAATVEARDLAQDVLEPLLRPVDGTAPVQGARYQELLSSVRQRVLVGPTDQVRIWRLDGTILFADDRVLVGERSPAPSGISLGDAPPGASRSTVDAGRFRTFTWLKIGNAPDLVAVEIARPYGPIVAGSEGMWQPWVVRALAAAALFGLLAAVTAVGAAVTERRRASRKEAEEASAPPPRSRWTPDLPEYMRPGYRQEVEARRRQEDEQVIAAVKAARTTRTPDAVTLPDAPTIPDAPPEHEDLEARLRRIAREREQEEDAVGTPA
jgi:hypothetical protein